MYRNLSFPGALDLIATIQACSWGRLNNDSGICDLGSESFIKLLTYPGANSVIDSEDGTKIDHTSFEMFIIIIIEGRRRHDDADRCILQIQQSKRNGG